MGTRTRAKLIRSAYFSKRLCLINVYAARLVCFVYIQHWLSIAKLKAVDILELKIFYALVSYVRSATYMGKSQIIWNVMENVA